MVKHVIILVDDLEHSEMVLLKGSRTWLEILRDGIVNDTSKLQD